MSTLLEVSGDDIARLGDGDLRDLVARLARAELRRNRCPISAVTAGGHQDASDGGIDVHVDCPVEVPAPDFVPRRLTGYQVKASDMPEAAIREEMQPKGALRESIRALAAASGAYVIVAGKGTVAQKRLDNRRQAMRSALGNLPSANQLHVDFYDRDRVAQWVNEYPGLVALLRRIAGRPVRGWRAMVAPTNEPFLFNEDACLLDGRSKDGKPLTVLEGVRLLRETIGRPGRCVRLVGLSGVGKTRFVHALFEESIGTDALDASGSVYTDYDESPEPSAHEMARDLIARGERAILIVDNCNPRTHTELARLCAAESSPVSLITVEYDVAADDEPEHTAEVLRLQSASSELVANWLKHKFPAMSEVDRETIASFSDGNFRVARAIGESLRAGESLGRLRSNDLFARIFWQTGAEDPHLLRAAEDLSLLYSIEGEDLDEGGELARLSALRGTPVELLYETLAKLAKRGVAQARGRYRAIMPQAIANWLAANALRHIPPGHLDRFTVALSPRMRKSVARRLGYLHDSEVAVTTVARWLKADGPLGDLLDPEGDGFSLIESLAPAAPREVLRRLEKELSRPRSEAFAGPRAAHHFECVRLVRAIGYEPELFEPAVMVMARFVASEPESNNLRSAREAFASLFHIVLSGTQARPDQRRAAIRRLATSDHPEHRASVTAALRALLKSRSFYGLPHELSFGARSRDWGWHPQGDQASDWFKEAIALTQEVASDDEARRLLAAEARTLWNFPVCRDALEDATREFLETRPWIGGWHAFRATYRYDGDKMPPEARERLKLLIDQLKPRDLLHRARAVVIDQMPEGGGWDIVDGEPDEEGEAKPWDKADQMAREVGRWLADDEETRTRFLRELLVAPFATRACECGKGLAEAATDLALVWEEMLGAFDRVAGSTQNEILLGGFIAAARQRDPKFASVVLDAVLNDRPGGLLLPFLQAWAGLDEEGLARLRGAVASGRFAAADFRPLARNHIRVASPEALAPFLEDIATLPGGVEVGCDILSTYFHCLGTSSVPSRLVALGREWLTKVDLRSEQPGFDYDMRTLVSVCLIGPESEAAARTFCSRFHAALRGQRTSPSAEMLTVEALFKVQPAIALDAFLRTARSDDLEQPFHPRWGATLPVENVELAILRDWAAHEPVLRYPLLGAHLSMFGDTQGCDELSPRFLALLDDCPDPGSFIGDVRDRLQSHGGSISPDQNFQRRKELLTDLAERLEAPARGRIQRELDAFDQWLTAIQSRERESEESFE